jgi:hypothetical protein
MRIALSFLLLIAGTAPAADPASAGAADRASPAAADPAPSMAMTMPLAEKVPVPGGDTYRLRFGSLLSPNDTCPVAKRPLNPRMRATWVNGKPIGFC